MTTLLAERPTETTHRRRSMMALFAAVALMSIAMTGASTAASLIAAGLGGDGASGLPNAAGVLGTALGALAAGGLMARHGRRFALLIMYGLATGGAVIAFDGALSRTLAPVVAGQLLLGLGNGGAQLSRYLAAELFPDSRKGSALSAIVWSGTVGAIVGPALISPAAGAAAGHGVPALAGPIVVSALATACAALATALLPRGRGSARRRVRTAARIDAAFRRPAVRLAVTAMAAAHVTMVAVMLMTPVQLHHHGHGLGLGVVGWILSAHMLGMFAFAPVSGRIADRLGGRVAIGAGSAVLVAAAVLAAVTSSTASLGLALFLLGYGWNLAFVGGSSVLSRDLPEETRLQLQGTVDAIVWSSAALASLSAGPLFGIGGYPLLAVLAGLLALLPVSLLARRPRAI
jgi:MFS family permease